MRQVKPYDLLIFDWDGTLSDSPAQIVAGMQEAIVELGLPPRRDEHIAELIGLGMHDGMGRLFPEHDTAELMRRLMAYRRRSPGNPAHPPLFPGTVDSLVTLHGAGYRLAVATGKQRSALDRSLAQHDSIAALLELTRCADETANKPDPLMLQQILVHTGVDADRALMIGDTEYDIAMAGALNMPALGVSCGVHESDRLRRAGACAVIDDVAALPRWLSMRPA